MGGHGGLNILPQKRWNVYNYDNRAKVERDKKKQHEKRNQEQKAEIENESISRLHELRHSKRAEYQDSDQSFFHQRKKDHVSEAVKKHQRSVIQQEKREKQPPAKPKGVNLFEIEEEMQKKSVQQQIEMRTEKYFEGKPFEMNTKFGGNFKNQPSVPWYSQPIESSKQSEKEQDPVTPKVSKQINEFRSKKSTDLFKVIDFSIKQEGNKIEEKERKNKSRSRSRSPKYSKSHRKSHKSEKKEAKNPAEDAAIIKKQKLIAERINREKVEAQKKRALLRENNIY